MWQCRGTFHKACLHGNTVDCLNYFGSYKVPSHLSCLCLSLVPSQWLSPGCCTISVMDLTFCVCDACLLVCTFAGKKKFLRKPPSLSPQNPPIHEVSTFIERLVIAPSPVIFGLFHWCKVILHHVTIRLCRDRCTVEARCKFIFCITTFVRTWTTRPIKPYSQECSRGGRYSQRKWRASEGDWGKGGACMVLHVLIILHAHAGPSVAQTSSTILTMATPLTLGSCVRSDH